MTDLRHIFKDKQVAQEFLDRFPELAGGRAGGFESFDAVSLPWSLDDAARTVRSMQEGSGEPIDRGFEAIVRRSGRPSYFVRDDNFDTADAPSSSEEVNRIVDGARTMLTKSKDGLVTHDASTLGGNSGSLVLDLASGKAAALHFGGIEGDTNWAVAAPVVRRLLAERVLS